MTQRDRTDAEEQRLEENARHERNWERWGPYLSERQWGTVREDYSADGSCWTYFPHDHARSRAYRWGEDGLLGLCDREERLCFALALWNERDPILKERLFGLTGPEGNHGEDVKEAYFYLDSTPTHSYIRALYKYPQAAFPYEMLLAENRRRSREEPEFELLDTGIFDENRYFNVFAEYAKADPDDILIRLTIENRGPEAAMLHVLPTLWFRNTWSWGQTGEGYGPKPRISTIASGSLLAEHDTLGHFHLAAQPDPEALLFTENETNFQKLFNVANPGPYVKDAFHERLISGRIEAVNPEQVGTKAAFWYRLELALGQSKTLRLRLCPENEVPLQAFGEHFEQIFEARRREADTFYATRTPGTLSDDARRIIRQAYAGLLWSKQFYYYDVATWLKGDPAQPPPPERLNGRNHEWEHLYNRDVISMPDKWEYPWYASWDLAFHMLPFGRIDPSFAKEQLILLLREWYMHPNGQIPAYEFAFSDANPPVHAWVCWHLYKMTGGHDKGDRLFLERVFQKLLLNFTWWANRKDIAGKHLFSGGFLGLDNIGLFDRSKPLPNGGQLEQADGTAWMAFYCSIMLAIALELAHFDHAYEDIASKFFEHFVTIVDAMNTIGGEGLWNEEDGFYYDQLLLNGKTSPLRIRSMVGLIPLFAVEILREETIERLPGFAKRMHWFLENRRDLASYTSYMEKGEKHIHGYRLLAIPSRQRLVRVLRYLLDEEEFLSPYGIRSLSRYHLEHPYSFRIDGQDLVVSYTPGESTTALFGGNSNWRGPIWFPVNYLLIRALEHYGRFYGETLRVECPAGSGHMLTLDEVAHELSTRLARIFLRDDTTGKRAWYGKEERFASDPDWRDLQLFHEYFHGDTGQGLGASHQTGWTALIALLLEDIGHRHARTAARSVPVPAKDTL
ncbi:MAG TPA: hypothetical protein VKV19_07365 [Ktedonobacteraceae bacterium]|nr:hypothetical protein [Ktedonobacteraceae bacterium]